MFPMSGFPFAEAQSDNHQYEKEKILVNHRLSFSHSANRFSSKLVRSEVTGVTTSRDAGHNLISLCRV